MNAFTLCPFQVASPNPFPHLLPMKFDSALSVPSRPLPTGQCTSVLLVISQPDKHLNGLLEILENQWILFML